MAHLGGEWKLSRQELIWRMTDLVLDCGVSVEQALLVITNQHNIVALGGWVR